MAWDRKHLLGLEGMTAEEITSILDTAQEMFVPFKEREVKKAPTLRGKTIINFFMENSTRTRSSFEVAGKRLSADTMNFSPSGSSVAKGETLKDTALTLNAMHPDLIVFRHSAPGSAKFLTQYTDAGVINAGDGAHEHPTQALLDMLSIRQVFGKLEGIKVAIVGDITHSRVVRSNLIGMATMGMDVTVCGPPTLMPTGIESFGAKVSHRIEEAIEGAQVVMMLRVQLERQKGPYFPSAKEYSMLYGLNRKRLELAADDAVVMHPGPMNRGVEIEPDIADSDRAIILDQVENGVALRMALLFMLSGAHDEVTA